MSELLAEQGEEAFDREHLKLVQNIYTCAIEIQDVIAKAVLDASSTERDE